MAHRVSFSDGLALVGIALSIVLLVLDKAGKLKGPLLFFLLGVAFLMVLPLAIGNSWVMNATFWGMKFARATLSVSLLGVFYSLVAIWISSGKNAETAGLESPSESPPLPEKAAVATDKPTVNWPVPAPISYGTALSTVQLNATASVAGTFAYSPGIGAVLPIGTNTVLAQFTPADGTKYSSVTTSVQLIVNPLQDTPKVSTVARLRDEQVKELDAVDEFIARKDEWALRETFDLPKMLQYNIRIARRSIAPRLVSKEESEDMDTYWKGGQGRIDSRFMTVRRVNNRIEVAFIPGKIGILNTSTKYIESRAKLSRFCDSPQLPTTVVKALREFNEAVEKNTDLMLESLNESLSADVRNILYNDDPSSQFLGSATGLYGERFVQLRPKAEKVNAAIRAAMGVQ